MGRMSDDTESLPNLKVYDIPGVNGKEEKARTLLLFNYVYAAEQWFWDSVSLTPLNCIIEDVEANKWSPHCMELG